MECLNLVQEVLRSKRADKRYAKFRVTHYAYVWDTTERRRMLFIERDLRIRTTYNERTMTN